MAKDTRTTKVLANGLTYNPSKINRKDYAQLKEHYPDISKIFPFRFAENKGGSMHIQPSALIATELRYLGMKYGCGQGFILRKLVELARETDSFDLSRD